jgi:hypothetical protein
LKPFGAVIAKPRLADEILQHADSGAVQTPLCKTLAGGQAEGNRVIHWVARPTRRVNS